MEDGLFIYWPVDEGIEDQLTAYDYSKTNGVANAHHGNIKLCKVSGTLPPANMLSLFAVTDSQGNYTHHCCKYSKEKIQKYFLILLIQWFKHPQTRQMHNLIKYIRLSFLHIIICIVTHNYLTVFIDITPYYFILLSITNQEKDAVYKRRPENEFIILIR